MRSVIDNRAALCYTLDMIDLRNLASYRENNRIEAKRAVGGFPRSVWETYSAFANTLGGIILLGVKENADHSLVAVDLPDPDAIAAEFWATVNDPSKVSVNILSRRDISVETVDSKRIVVITVPRAQRTDKPVYIDNNPTSGTYRRNGEGDYRCRPAEVRAMQRDAALKSHDMHVLQNSGLNAFDPYNIFSYRVRMKKCRPGHAFLSLSNNDFLLKLDAVGYGDDGRLYPTAAGLLMFGYPKEILKRFPHYSLKLNDKSVARQARVKTQTVYNFYFDVAKKLTQGISVADGEDDARMHKALCEALANSIINADYHSIGGIEVVKTPEHITFSNPGGFRIDIEAAVVGGISDPRNAALKRMFNLIDVGQGSGSGIPNIYAVWKSLGLPPPQITESFDPERITLSLAIEKSDIPHAQTDSAAAHVAQKAAIVEYLTDRAGATVAELAELLGIKTERIQELLTDLISADVVIPDNTDPIAYRLKR